MRARLRKGVHWLLESDRRILIAVFLVALALRLGLVAMLPANDTVFADAPHLEIAKHFAEDEGFWLAGPYKGARGHVGPDRVYCFRPPLFPFLWGLIYKATNGSYVPVRVTHAFLSAGMCALIFPIGMRLFGRDRGKIPAALGALIAALYPPLVWHGVHLMTEPLFIFFQTLGVLLLLAAADKSSPFAAAAAGAAFGLAILSRSVLVAFVPLAALWLLWATWRKKAEGSRPLKKGLALGAVFLLLTGLVMLPWVIRNAVVLHALVPTTTDAGHGFYVANNERSLEDPRGFYMPDKWDFALKPGETQLDEVTINRRLFAMGLRFCVAHPGQWVRLMARRFCRFWRFYPHLDQVKDFASAAHVIIYAVSYIPLFPLMIVGLFLAHRENPGRRTAYWLIYALVAYTAVIHTVFLATIRYRVPLMPVLIPFAAYAIYRAFGRASRPRSTEAAGSPMAKASAWRAQRN